MPTVALIMPFNGFLFVYKVIIKGFFEVWYNNLQLFVLLLVFLPCVFHFWTISLNLREIAELLLMESTLKGHHVIWKLVNSLQKICKNGISRCINGVLLLPFSSCSICSVENEVLFRCSFRLSLSLSCESSSPEELWSEFPSEVASLIPSLPNSLYVPASKRQALHFVHLQPITHYILIWIQQECPRNLHSPKRWAEGGCTV